MTPEQRREMEEMFEGLISCDDAAERKGVTRRSIIRVGKRGMIKLVKVSGVYMVDEASLRGWSPQKSVIR
jgi:hypothetical protein